MNSDPFYRDTLNTRLVGMVLAIVVIVSSGLFGLDSLVTLTVAVVGLAGWIVASLRMVGSATRKQEANDR